MLLTRAPLYSWYCYHFLVRLACVRHAASVDSEPGSNSRLKLLLPPNRRRSARFSGIAPSKKRDAYFVRMIKPNLIFSHDWHVQPNCQRSLRALRLSGALWDRGPALRPACPRTCCACQLRVRLRLRRFCANLSNISKICPPVKSGQDDFRSKARTAQNIKQLPAQNAPEPLRLTGVSSWVLQSLFSRVSLQGFQGLLPHL